MNDLKSAFRQLLKNPGFTAVDVVVVAGTEVRSGLGLALDWRVLAYALLIASEEVVSNGSTEPPSAAVS